MTKMDKKGCRTEPEFVHVSGAQESIPINRFRQAGNRFLSFLKGIQIRAQAARLHRLAESIP
jgi:hypothetical protein